MKKKIAVLSGGDSSERIISERTAQMICEHLPAAEYEAFLVSIQASDWKVLMDSQALHIDKNDFSFQLDGQKQSFDAVFMAIHGTPGEDGKLQAYFDLIGIPYSNGSHLDLALTFNKWYCSTFLKQLGYSCADSILLRKQQAYDATKIADQIGFPCFVKPNNGGSSFGMSKVKAAEQLEGAIQLAFEHDDQVMIESQISGTEVTCGVIETPEGIRALPLTEIVTHNDFFDFEAKYEGASQEITPARITDDMRQKVQETALSIYRQLDMKGIVRIDFMIQDETPFVIEVNAVPGLSKESIVPQQAAAEGISFSELLRMTVEVTLNRK